MRTFRTVLAFLVTGLRAKKEAPALEQELATSTEKVSADTSDELVVQVARAFTVSPSLPL